MRALKDGVVDFDAVGDREDAVFLALTAVFEQHGPVRHKRLLHRTIIEEFSRVLHRNAARITLLILQPQYAERARADVITRLSLVFIDQIDHEEVETFLLVFAGECDRRAALLVTQQRIDAVVMLGDETGGSILSRREGRSVDNSPQFPVAVDERILHRRHFLIQPDLVLLEVFSADKTSFVVRLFRTTFGVYAGDLASLDAIAANLFETRTRAINENYRFDNLLGRIFPVFRVLFGLGFRVWFGFLFGLLFSALSDGRGRPLICLCIEGYRR